MVLHSRIRIPRLCSSPTLNLIYLKSDFVNLYHPIVAGVRNYIYPNDVLRSLVRILVVEASELDDIVGDYLGLLVAINGELLLGQV